MKKQDLIFIVVAIIGFGVLAGVLFNGKTSGQETHPEKKVIQQAFKDYIDYLNEKNIEKIIPLFNASLAQEKAIRITLEQRFFHQDELNYKVTKSDIQLLNHEAVITFAADVSYVQQGELVRMRIEEGVMHLEKVNGDWLFILER